jgi:hypothetical protein
VPDILDAIRLKGAKFCVEYGFLEFAEEMLAELSFEASASLAATELKQRLRDSQIAFWRARYNLASVVTARFPNYLAGRLYADLCRSRSLSFASRRISLD